MYYAGGKGAASQEAGGTDGQTRGSGSQAQDGGKASSQEHEAPPQPPLIILAGGRAGAGQARRCGGREPDQTTWIPDGGGEQLTFCREGAPSRRRGIVLVVPPRGAGRGSSQSAAAHSRPQQCVYFFLGRAARRRIEPLPEAGPAKGFAARAQRQRCQGGREGDASCGDYVFMYSFLPF